MRIEASPAATASSSGAQLRGGTEVKLAAHREDANSILEMGGGGLEGRRIHAGDATAGGRSNIGSVCPAQSGVGIERRRGKLCSPHY